MKRLKLITVLTFLSLFTQAQMIIDLNSTCGKSTLNSLTNKYLDTDKDTSLRLDLFDWPLFYHQAFFNHFDKMYQDIKQNNLNLNFQDMYFDYFVSENGDIDYFIYNMVPAKNRKITNIDHEFIKSFILKNKQIELKSKKKYRHHNCLLFSPISKIIIEK